jgi:hypothetical protein
MAVITIMATNPTNATRKKNPTMIRAFFKMYHYRFKSKLKLEL